METKFAPIGFESTGVNSASTDILLDTNLSRLLNSRFIDLRKVPMARRWYEKRLSFIVTKYNYSLFKQFQRLIGEANIATTNVARSEMIM